jgi:hypothetical protein
MRLSQFAKSESGAVTVDWVVLTGSLVGLGLASASVVSNGVESLSFSISESLSNMDVGSVGAFEPEPGWGDLQVFSWISAEAGEFHMEWALQVQYNGDRQAQFNDVLSSLNSAIQSGNVDQARFDVDRYGYLTNYAAQNNIQLGDGSHASYAEMHAIVLAMQQ